MSTWIPYTTKNAWLAERKKVTTSTEIAALVGVHKYGNTAFGLYHSKRGTIEDEWEPNERSEIGLAVEHSIARMAAKKLGVKVRRQGDFCVSGTMGASFDYAIVGGAERYMDWFIECKNVDALIFRDQWGKGDAGRPVAPEHIIIQTQAQLEVSGCPGIVLAALVGGNRLELVEIARDEEFGHALRVVSDAFWDRIADGIEPAVTGDDVDHLARLYGASRRGSVIEADHELEFMMGAYADAKACEKAAVDATKQVKAQIMQRIADAEKVIGSEYVIDAGNTNPSTGTLITQEMVGGYVGARAGFRRFVMRERKN